MLMLTDGSLPGVQKILAVDDNSSLLEMVQLTLEKEGFWVSTAVSGQQALSLIKKDGLPHLAIVDLNMPVMDGFELCAAIHKFAPLPIIMLTAINDEQTVVDGLNLYAEDYIFKPFRPRELVARIRRVLRRTGGFGYTLAPRVVVDARLQIDFPHRQFFLDGEQRTLTSTESRLLYILMQNAGRTIPYQTLLQRLWPTEMANEERLHTHIYRLRRKIEPDSKNPRYILSEWGIGYLFPARKMLSEN